MDRITGLMVYYYFVCHKKLWYHLKNINLESESENVGIGKLIDESCYLRADKHISIDDTINIDFMKNWRVLHDIKKSKSIEEASIWQMKYYLYYLRKKGLNIEKGIIDYPLLKERKEVTLSNDDKIEMDKIILDIKRIKKLEIAPSNLNNKVCSKCAFYEYCFC
ncbi:CRISPR-associated protein Cas4 [Peptostreptococcus sp. D1]|uniref:CRISPR-associated protein Cas4 n=1 Tax=Peptostreptococcus sp. D1 TaxID=72304 RepID=UPI0008E4AB4E|nr:CRISPR-associated protein Cas4 [Peptostreptococcus sp. D1]SFE57816.1 CRISPR-associated exonuclease Cas4 [Peptostreptococcus sp. D1]